MASSAAKVSIECQLARSQIRVYVAGDDLPPETVRELERHIAVCPTCQAEVKAQREHLESGKQTPPDRPKSLVQKVLERLPRKSTPLVLSSLLAVVLVAMSTFPQWSKTILGEKATVAAVSEKAEGTAKSEKSDGSDKSDRSDRPDESDPPQPSSKPAPPSSTSTPQPPPKPPTKAAATASTAPAVRPAPMKRPAPPKRSAPTRRPAVRPQAQRPRPNPVRRAPVRRDNDTGTIVIYDAQGNPIRR